MTLMPLVEAARGRRTKRAPVWIMRQAGRHLPEYRKLRSSVSFQEAVATPEIAAELTCQPIERYGMDGAVIFADIMTPLEAMGVDIDFAPGPKLRPHSLEEVAGLGPIDPGRLGHIAATIALVRKAVPAETAVIGFAGAPLTLLAYLVQGGGSKDFATMRGAIRRDPVSAADALGNLAQAMNAYLTLQVEAGADIVQLFDSWAGVADRATYNDLVVPSAATAICGLEVPRIYFAPHAPHTLDLQHDVDADVYGLDWRLPIDEAWKRVGADAVQGNLDPAVLLSDPATIREHVADISALVAGRGGHIFNLGHGIDKDTPPEHVSVMVDAVRS